VGMWHRPLHMWEMVLHFFSLLAGETWKTETAWPATMEAATSGAPDWPAAVAKISPQRASSFTHPLPFLRHKTWKPCIPLASTFPTCAPAHLQRMPSFPLQCKRPRPAPALSATRSPAAVPRRAAFRHRGGVQPDCCRRAHLRARPHAQPRGPGTATDQRAAGVQL